MKTPQEIRNLADQRLQEAKVLCAANMCDGAFYLAAEWSESCRYKPCGYCDPQDARDLIQYIEDQNGLQKWIRQQ